MMSIDIGRACSFFTETPFFTVSVKNPQSVKNERVDQLQPEGIMWHDGPC